MLTRLTPCTSKEGTRPLTIASLSRSSIDMTTVNHEQGKDEEERDVKIIIKGVDDKETDAENNIYAFCNHCKKDISVVYMKSEGKHSNVVESLSPRWPLSNYHTGDYVDNDYDKCQKDNDYEGCKKLLDKKKKKKKIQDLWENFLEGCTLHGFHYCFSGNPPLRRLVWIVLLLGAFSLFFEKCSESINSYFQYPFTTTTLLVYNDSLPFPAISLCNRNDARMSRINGTLMDRVFRARQGMKGSNPEDGKLQVNITGAVMNSTLANAKHELQDMIKECSWQKDVPCSSANFTEFKTADGDFCYTFNSGQNGVKLRTSEVGAKNGLRLLIDIQHHEYYYDVKSAGFSVILHDQEETPVKLQGIYVPPGFATYLELKRQKVTNLPFPFKTNCGMPKLKYFDKYTKSKCFLDKLTQYVDAKCKCKVWFMPGNAKMCDFETAEKCAWPAWAYFEDQKLDKCPIACQSVEYSGSMSYARFPSNSYVSLLSKKYGLKGTHKENRDFLRDNLLELHIYYEGLTYKDIRQVPSYDLFSLLGDVGGQIGLFLGASLLTIVEYLDLMGMIAYTSYKYKN